MSFLGPSWPCAHWLALLPMQALCEAGLCHNAGPQTEATGNPVCSKLSFICRNAQGPLDQEGENLPLRPSGLGAKLVLAPWSPGLGWHATQTLGAACSPAETSHTTVAVLHLPCDNRGSGPGAHISMQAHVNAHPRVAFCMCPPCTTVDKQGSPHSWHRVGSREPPGGPHSQVWVQAEAAEALTEGEAPSPWQRDPRH